MKKIILSIEGMTCSACSNGLEKYLNKQNGVVNASVNLVMANAVIEGRQGESMEVVEESVAEEAVESIADIEQVVANEETAE